MLLISGICGFVGSTLAKSFLEQYPDLKICGFDNFSRPGSELNRRALKSLGVSVVHADVRSQSDIDSLPAADWVIDAAANPSVLAGVDGSTSSRQLIEHNLVGTINLLEYCKRQRAGFTLLSTSRVYSISGLSQLGVSVDDKAFMPISPFPDGITSDGVSECYSTAAPVSLYGSTKIASEVLALEYGATFGFSVWINRCGVLAGAGQFGRPDQGIFSFWINSWLRNAPLRYIGFDGRGHQVRDCLHPRDLVPLIRLQMDEPVDSGKPRIMNLAGGVENSMSLAQLSRWCAARFDAREVAGEAKPRPFDIPWMVLDISLAESVWNWRPTTPVVDILKEIARHAEGHSDWLDLSLP